MKNCQLHTALAIAIFAALLFSAAACKNKEDGASAKYSINVKFDGNIPELLTDKRIILFNDDTLSPISDTATVVGNKAVLSGEIKDPDFCTLKFVGINPKTGKERIICRLFLENDSYTINVPEDEHLSAEIIGGRTQKVIDSLQYTAEKIIKKSGLDKAPADSSSLAKRDSVTKEIESVKNRYINSHPLSMYALYQQSSDIEYIPIDSVKKVYKKFEAAEEYGDSKYFKKIKKYAEKQMQLSEGRTAPDFIQTGIFPGDTVCFSNIYKGNKITMLTFWSSESKPCREFNKIMRRLYYKYRRKGFGIISVSIDSVRVAWTDAIYKDKLSWPQCSDLKGWKNIVAQKYLVRSVPQSILVDSTGKIILSRPKEDQIDGFLEKETAVETEEAATENAAATNEPL